MINPDLDIARWRAALAAHGRVQIDAFLQADAAAFLQGVLREQVRWTLAYRRDGQSQTLPADALAALGDAERDALLGELATHARGRYGFAYDSYMMVTAYKEGRDPQLPLHRVLEFLNAPEHLHFIRVLSGNALLRRVNAQATRYRPGHFLKRHNDVDHEEGRQYAYVINLTPRWEADWGGLLQFTDADGRVVDTFMPRYNSLSLFKVPHDHSVTLVAPWAEESRFAITGWWLT